MLACVLFLLVLPGCARALLLTSSSSETQALTLHGELDVLRDASGALTVADMATPTVAARFAPARDSLAYGFTRDVVWLRFRLAGDPDNDSHFGSHGDDWFLEVAPHYLENLTLYRPIGNGAWTTEDGGMLQPFGQRNLVTLNPTFALHPQATPATWYLRIQSRGTVYADPRIWHVAGLVRHSAMQYGLLGLTVGVMLLLIVSNLTVWMWLRERIYLAFGLYVLAAMARLLFVTGLAGHLLPGAPQLLVRGLGVSICISLAAAAWFLPMAVELRRHYPRLTLPIRLGVAAHLLAALGAACGAWPWLAVPTLLFAMLQLLAFWTLAVSLVMRGQHQYAIYVIAFTIINVVGGLLILRNVGLVDLGASGDMLLIACDVLHAVLLHAALVLRVRHADQARMRAERKQLRSAREIEAALEQRVAERTRDLQLEITERRQLEARLQTVLAESQQTNADQREFISMVSHEFGTPLSIIDSSSQTLDLLLPGDNPAVTRRLDKIRSAVALLTRLLHNFLTEDRLATRQIAARRVPTDLGVLAREVAILIQPSTTLLLKVDAPLGAIAPCDRTLIEIALNNLVTNAIKYSGTSSRVVIRSGCDEHEAWVEVVDDGVGIEQKNIERIFDKFYRNSAHYNLPGVGLGLYLTRRICELHGGRVECISMPGEGARFRISLPRVVPVADGGAANAAQEIARGT